MASTRHLHILLGIETDPTLYHGENARRPALLDSGQARQVLAQIATDLAASWPGRNQYTLSMAGALFDQAQVLRPQLPVFGALETLWQAAADTQQVQLAFGVEDQQMPHPQLQPDRAVTPGALQLLPLLLSYPTDNEMLATLDIDRHFAEYGQLSRASADSLKAHFQVTILHTRFMSLAHLGGLLQQQLEHYGLLPLWELLDAAISQQDDPLEVHTAQGARFKWQDGVVHGFFEPLDWWANLGSGIAEAGPHLQAAYAEWVRGYRRYQSVLATHGIDIVQHLPGLGDAALRDSFLLEESTLTPEPGAAPVTEHSTNELGVVAVTVVNGRRQMNFYPLESSGLNDLHRYLHQHGLGGDIAYPGRICYDENGRQLIAETLPA